MKCGTAQLSCLSLGCSVCVTADLLPLFSLQLNGNLPLRAGSRKENIRPQSQIHLSRVAFGVMTLGVGLNSQLLRDPAWKRDGWSRPWLTSIAKCHGICKSKQQRGGIFTSLLFMEHQTRASWNVRFRLKSQGCFYNGLSYTARL